MNERIRELMGNTLDEKFAGTWSTMDMQDLTKFAERFAELIVRECAKVAVEQEDYCEMKMIPTYAIDMHILEHFGVKE